MTKVYKTKRLFYGKWPFKVETCVPGAAFLMRRGISEVRKFCLGQSDSLYRPNYSEVEKKTLLSFISEFEKINLEKVKYRAEWNTLNFYTDNVNDHEFVKQTLSHWVVKVTEPASQEELELLINSGVKSVLCNKLPYDKFRYRVIMKNGMPINNRQKFFEWSRNFTDSVQATEKTSEWLLGNQRYLQDPYIYVESSKQLTFVKLFLGQYVSRCEEYVVRDTQNTGK